MKDDSWKTRQTAPWVMEHGARELQVFVEEMAIKIRVTHDNALEY